jgi:broad specificity phosphatase PhoE
MPGRRSATTSGHLSHLVDDNLAWLPSCKLARRPFRQPQVTRLFLVRPGETETAARGVIAGRLDVRLSRRGLDHARAVGESLSKLPLAAMYSSTSRRALESARVIARLQRLETVPDRDLCEIDFGALEGLTFDEGARRFPVVAAAWVSQPHAVTFTGGECLATLQGRVARSIERIVKHHPSASVALVCHAGPIRAFAGGALGLAPEVAFRLRCEHRSLPAGLRPPAPCPGR